MSIRNIAITRVKSASYSILGATPDHNLNIDSASSVNVMYSTTPYETLKLGTDILETVSKTSVKDAHTSCYIFKLGAEAPQSNILHPQIWKRLTSVSCEAWNMF